MADGNVLQHHPSALRNRIPILKQLLKLLPPSDDFSGLALEVASGTGAHLEVYAPAFPQLTFLPSEYIPEKAVPPDQQWSEHGKIGLRLETDELANIDARGCKVFPNVKPSVALDLTWPWDKWPEVVRDAEGSVMLIICSNTLHISPWECSVNLFRCAGLALAPGGHLILYGPFKVHGQFIGPDGGAGNAAFNEKLRATNPAWGLRDVDELSPLASAAGLAHQGTINMPANNLVLHFVKETEESRKKARI